MIGDRQGHGDLAIVLLAKLAAILPRNPDRMSPLLGEARVIDDPSFNRPVALYGRQYHLTDLGQNLSRQTSCLRLRNATTTDVALPSVQAP